MRVVVELQAGRRHGRMVVLNQLYKHTAARRATFGVILLVDRRPAAADRGPTLEWSWFITTLQHRREVTLRRWRRFELRQAQAKERRHVLEGLLKALDQH